MEGTTVAYRCPASKESALQWIQLYQEAANITLTTYDSMSNGQRVVYWVRALVYEIPVWARRVKLGRGVLLPEHSTWARQWKILLVQSLLRVQQRPAV